MGKIRKNDYKARLIAYLRKKWGTTYVEADRRFYGYSVEKQFSLMEEFDPYYMSDTD